MSFAQIVVTCYSNCTGCSPIKALASYGLVPCVDDQLILFDGQTWSNPFFWSNPKCLLLEPSQNPLCVVIKTYENHIFDADRMLKYLNPLSFLDHFLSFVPSIARRHGTLWRPGR